MKITSVIFDISKVNELNHRVELVATFEDGTTRSLFAYYPDELSFKEKEFIGLTAEEAIALYRKKDQDYMRK